MTKQSKVLNPLPAVGRYTSIPAGIIDKIYLEDPGLIRFIKLRTTYLGLFLPLALVDATVSASFAITHAGATFFIADSKQDQHSKQQKKYATLFSKNLYALLASPFGIVNPKLITFYFIGDNFEEMSFRSGGRANKKVKEMMVTPKNVAELTDIIKYASENDIKIMPLGSGLSQGKQFIPEGGKKVQIIDLSLLKDIHINPVDKTVTVGAGAQWSDIQIEANKARLALKVMQASNVFSVGGSVGTNIHGWDHINGSLANVIISMRVINAKGVQQTIYPGDPLFDHITGGFGLFGIVVSVTLQLTDNVLLKETAQEIPIADYVTHFRENVQNSEHIKMHLYRLSLDPKNLLSTGISVDFCTVDNEEPLAAKDLVQESTQGKRSHNVLVNVARRWSLARAFYWNSEKKRLLANDTLPLSNNEIMHPPIKAMLNPSVSETEWLQEYFLPEENLSEFIAQLGTLLTENKVCLLNASVRFVKQHQQSPLSPAHDGDRFAVVLCWKQFLNAKEVVKAEKWLRQAQRLTVNMGGSYYLPYQHVSSPDDFNKSYPHAREAQEYKERVDPKTLFSSGFHKKYMAPKGTEPNYFQVIMNDPHAQAQFKGFLERVLQRVKAKKLYTLLEDVMRYKDSHAEIYAELCVRLPEIMPGALGSLKRILKSLSDIKTDLGAQALSLLPQDLRDINGLVEIGYPGRFINGFKKNYHVTGRLVAVYEAPSPTDYIQTGYPRPYHTFAQLDYKKPGLNSLRDNSADLITCYVGLHHFPIEELDVFLADIRRVLRPGGHFILVDHDVQNEQSLAMAHMAHTIFNAVNGVSVEEEMAEFRNFHPMSHWQELLAKHDLGYVAEGEHAPRIRNQDPSQNRMVCFKSDKLELAHSSRVMAQLGGSSAALSSQPPVPEASIFSFSEKPKSSVKVEVDECTSVMRVN